MNSSLCYTFFLLTSLTAGKTQKLETSYFVCQHVSLDFSPLETYFTVHRDHLYTQTICNLQHPLPCCSIFFFLVSSQFFSHALLEPEVIHYILEIDFFRLRADFMKQKPQNDRKQLAVSTCIVTEFSQRIQLDIYMSLFVLKMVSLKFISILQHSVALYIVASMRSLWPFQKCF